MNFRQEVEICIQKLSICSFHHLFSNFQSEFHLIVNNLHRMFFEKSKSINLQQHQMRSFFSRSFDKCNSIVLFVLILYKFALRHILLRRHYLFSKRSNSKFSDLHMFAKIFRVNSRFRFTSRFTFFDFRNFFIQFQFANVVKNISSFICLTNDLHRSFRESKTMKYSWKLLIWKSIDLKKS